MKTLYQITSSETGTVILRRRKIAKALRWWLREDAPVPPTGQWLDDAEGPATQMLPAIVEDRLEVPRLAQAGSMGPGSDLVAEVIVDKLPVATASGAGRAPRV